MESHPLGDGGTVEASRMAVEELMEVLVRASIEAVLQLSAQGAAGVNQQGKKGGKTGWHGTQHGTVYLSDRKLKVTKPRLRRKGRGKGAEVKIPAYEAMNTGEGVSRNMLEIVMRGVSTRNYHHVIPEMAQTVGISGSAVSREFIEASEEECRRLCERRLEGMNLLVLSRGSWCSENIT